jgi:hypothetical protein
VRTHGWGATSNATTVHEPAGYVETQDGFQVFCACGWSMPTLRELAHLCMYAHLRDPSG